MFNKSNLGEDINQIMAKGIMAMSIPSLCPVGVVKGLKE
jgi:hypothetical protein